MCYLAAPRPTFGHLQGESLTHPILITASFFEFLTQRSPEPRNEIGSQTLAKPVRAPIGN